MTRIPGIRLLVRLPATESRVASEIEDEIAFHIEERSHELMARGMDPEAARAEALREFGNVREAKSELERMGRRRVRRTHRAEWWNDLWQDVRYAVRTLRRAPGFALVAIVSLGLGIGANTAIFSLIDAVLLRPLPVSDPEELVALKMGEDSYEFTNPLWEAIRDRQDLFSGAFAFAAKNFDLASGGEARPVVGSWVSGDFFNTLGVPAAAGRVLSREDDVRGCPAVAVLGHDLWRSSYGSDPGVVGRAVSLDGHPFEIVGVAAAGFFGAEVGRSSQVYAPLCSMAISEPNGGGLDERSIWYLSVMARPRGEFSAVEVNARLKALSPAVFRATLPTNFGREEARLAYLSNTLAADPAANGFSGLRSQFHSALLTLMGLVGLVLLIACANIANLLLARAATRRHEVAIRLAIGAGRGRLIRQLLTESLLLSLLGATVGLLFATWASGLLLRFLAPRGASVWLDLSLDIRVLGFTLAVASATAILFGLAPAWRSTRVSPQAAMKVNERSIAEGHSRFTLGKALVVGQIALSLVLVLVAGLLLGTFRELATLDPGFNANGVLLVHVDLRKGDYPPEQLPVVKNELLERMRSLPGVRSASASAITPVSGAGWNGPVTVEGFVPANPRDGMIFLNAVTEDYFATLGTPLLAGRDIEKTDVAGGPAVAVINEAMANKFFGARNPVGESFGFQDGPSGESKPVQVIGLVRDTKYRSLREETIPLAYLSMSQEGFGGSSLELELRSRDGARPLIPEVTAAIGEINEDFSIRYTTLEEQVSGSLSRERLLATLSGFFGGLALLLAAVGVYGTMAYTVERRRNEVRIRIALGAFRTRVMLMVLGEAGRLVAAGLLLGGAVALATTRWVTSFLFGVRPAEPAIWAISVLALAVVSMTACALPAWRAARLDAKAALRAH